MRKEINEYYALATVMISDAYHNVKVRNQYADGSARFLLRGAEMWYAILGIQKNSKLHKHYTLTAQNFLDNNIETTDSIHTTKQGRMATTLLKFRDGRLVDIKEIIKDNQHLTDKTIHTRKRRFPKMFADELVLSKRQFRALDKSQYV